MNAFWESEIREQPVGERKFNQGVSIDVPSHQWDAGISHLAQQRAIKDKKKANLLAEECRVCLVEDVCGPIAHRSKALTCVVLKSPDSSRTFDIEIVESARRCSVPVEGEFVDTVFHLPVVGPLELELNWISSEAE